MSNPREPTRPEFQRRRAAVAALLEGRCSATGWLDQRGPRGPWGADGARLARELDAVEARERVGALVGLALAALAPCAGPARTRATHAGPRPALLGLPTRSPGWARSRAARALVATAEGPDGGEMVQLARAFDREERGPAAARALFDGALGLAVRAGLPTSSLRAALALLDLAAADGCGAARALGELCLREDGSARPRTLLGLAAAHEIAGRPRLALLALDGAAGRTLGGLAARVALTLALGGSGAARRAALEFDRRAPGERGLARLVELRRSLWRAAPDGAHLSRAAADAAARLGFDPAAPSGAIGRARP